MKHYMYFGRHIGVPFRIPLAKDSLPGAWHPPAVSLSQARLSTGASCTLHKIAQLMAEQNCPVRP